jgi:hypothetical protein
MSDNPGPNLGQQPASSPIPPPAHPVGALPVQEPPGGWPAALARSQLWVKSLTVAVIVLAVATLISGTLAVGFAAWGFSQSWSGGTRGGPGHFMDDRASGGQSRVALERLFTSDGSLDSRRVQRLRDRMESGEGPSPMAVRFAIGRAVVAGDITTTQAEELATALGLDGAGTMPPPLRPTPTVSPPTPTPTPGVPRTATPAAPATPVLP